jgi:uncharacterized delta-60 repeat protein
MSESDQSCRCAAGVQLRRSLFAVTAAIVLAVGAGGAQAGGGALDPSFGRGGKVLTAVGIDGGASAVAIQADGKIVAAGGAPPARPTPREPLALALARYNSDGRLDATFGRGGRVSTRRVLTPVGGAYGGANAIVLQKDGRIVVAGGRAIVRYTTNGQLDKSFGIGGRAVDRSPEAYYDTIALQRDGKIVVGGSDSLARYSTSGRLDPSFGIGGKLVERPAPGTGTGARRLLWYHALALQQDGKIIAAGVITTFTRSGKPQEQIVLARYTSRGGLDSSFGSGGKIVSNFGGDSGALAVAVQNDGNIVVTGWTGVYPNRHFALLRYTPDGKLDPTFGQRGATLTDFGGKVDTAHALALQEDGLIVAAGYSENRSASADFALARYTSGGKLDPSFGTGGKVLTDFGADRFGSASSVAIQQDGKIVAAGPSGAGGTNGDSFALVRYLN